MRIDILHVADCPNLGLARERVSEAIAEAAVPATVFEREVTAVVDAVRIGMRGSPTILIDGRDPFAGDTAPSVSCRLYRTATGTEGAPSVADLVGALGA